jgi:alpha-galactosidase
MKSTLRTTASALLLLTVLAGLPRAKAAESKTAAPGHPEKVLVLGNSITKHGPKPDIGWTGNWGMAASSEDKDFVHLIQRALAAPTGTKPTVMAVNIAEFERNYATYDIEAKLKDASTLGADCIILAIGENVPSLATGEARAQFKAGVLKLLRYLKGTRNPRIIVRSSFWANAAKDEVLKQACEETGGIFVDISSLGKDESNYARSERPFKHEGVARHPGDKGMQAIADALVGAIR